MGTYRSGLELSGLLKEGSKHFTGVDEAVVRNIDACKELAQLTRSSLGPNGMNKLVINHLEKVFVTSDTGTIMREMEVVHPAAKMVTLATEQQEKEHGDNTNLVVTIAGELASNAHSLLRMGMHVAEIVSGYSKAQLKVEEILAGLVAFNIETMNEAELVKALRPVIASKQHGLEDVLAPLITQAALAIMPRNPKNFVVDNVRVAKVLGASIHQSHVVTGMVLTRAPESTIKKVSNAKIAIFNVAIDASATETKGTVLMKGASDLMNYNISEEKAVEKVISEIAASGATVVVSQGAISEIALHFIDRYKLMAVRLTSKFDNRRLCKATGATALARVGGPTPEELGEADVVELVEIGGTWCTVIKNEKGDSSIATIVVRGSTQNFLDDVERAIDDGVNVVKGIAKDGRHVPGAGATEIEVARQLKAFADKTPGLDQYAIRKFGEAFEIIPRTLAENAGHTADDVISALYAEHEKGNTNVGVDIETSLAGTKCTVDAVEAGICDHLEGKRYALKLAANAAITVLRVDQIIMAKQAGGPKA